MKIPGMIVSVTPQRSYDANGYLASLATIGQETKAGKSNA